jgi:beta-barrel assembly-enhancing protease
LTKAYGLQLLLGILLGNNQSQLAQIAADLAAGVTMLAFSRDAENESDEYSVKYLFNTAYDATGVKGFFEKIEGSSQPPEFLSTHPSPDNRYDHILEVKASLDSIFGPRNGNTFVESYNQFKSTLP